MTCSQVVLQDDPEQLLIIRTTSARVTTPTICFSLLSITIIWFAVSARTPAASTSRADEGKTMSCAEIVSFKSLMSAKINLPAA